MDQDDTIYQQKKPECKCHCYAHCGHSCMTDDCDCNECSCTLCEDELKNNLK